MLAFSSWLVLWPSGEAMCVYENENASSFVRGGIDGRTSNALDSPSSPSPRPRRRLVCCLRKRKEIERRKSIQARKKKDGGGRESLSQKQQGESILSLPAMLCFFAGLFFGKQTPPAPSSTSLPPPRAGKQGLRLPSQKDKKRKEEEKAVYPSFSFFPLR